MTAREAQITSPPPSLGTGTTITPRRSSGGSCFLKIWLRFGNILHSFWRGENVRAEQSAVGPARTRPGPGNGELSVAGGSGHTEPGAPPGPDPVKTSYSHRTRWSLPPRPQAQWGRRLAACPVQCAQKSRALFLAVCFGMSEAHSDPRQARLAFHSHLRSATPPGTGRAHAQRPGGRCPSHVAGVSPRPGDLENLFLCPRCQNDFWFLPSGLSSPSESCFMLGTGKRIPLQVQLLRRGHASL